MSLNNMSIDMFHLQHLGDRNLDAIQEQNEDQSVDFSHEHS